MKNRLRHWIERLETAGSLPTDPAEERLRKAILTFLASIYCVAGILWGIAYAALGLPLASAFPLGYSLVSGISLVYFIRSKRYGFFRFSQLLLILLLPFLLQYSLGGFAPSSTVMIWSILCPIGALLFAGTTRALPWFVAYLCLLVFSGILDIGAAQQPVHIPSLLSTAFFMMNIGGVSTIFYVLLSYFVREREQAMAVLDKEHRRVLREKERLDKIKSILAHFVPETAKSIIETDPEKGRLDRHVQEATVLFLDIEGFTHLLEVHPAQKIHRAVESYFSVFYDLIQKHGGDINETAGDGMMVIFLESDPAQRAKDAVQAAVEIHEYCPRAEETADAELIPIRVNIGICSGEVYLGSTKMRGSAGDRWTFTASGPVTILAARLSDYAQGGQILIGGGTAHLIKDSFRMASLGKVHLKNFRDPVEVFQVLP